MATFIYILYPVMFMVSAIRMARKKRQVRHIPSPQAWQYQLDGSLKLIDNPELKELIPTEEDTEDASTSTTD